MRDELTKRILYIENGVGFGGAVVSLRAFLANADLDRFPPILVHSLDDPKFSTFNARVKRVRLPKLVLPEVPGLTMLRKANVDVFGYAMRIARVARRESVSCIYLNNDLIANLAGLIAGSVLGLPVVQHERDIPAPTSRLATSLSSRASRVLAISGPVRAALERMDYPRERIRMVPEGLELDRYQPIDEQEVEAVRRSLGLSAGDRAVVIVGMVMDWKGQHMLIEAAPLVLARHPDAKFLIVGESPSGAEDYARRLSLRVKQLGLERKVTFVGYRGDVPSVIQACEILVHASTSPEPFGRVVIEGMVMRKPVIATDIGAPPEIIRHGETGLLVPPENPKELAGAISGILDDPETARRIGQQAHAEALAKYSIHRHVALIESVFEELFWGAPRALPSPALALRQ